MIDMIDELGRCEECGKYVVESELTEISKVLTCGGCLSDLLRLRRDLV